MSVLEVFAQGGRAVATKRSYLRGTQRGVAIYNHGAAPLTVVSAEVYRLQPPTTVAAEELRAELAGREPREGARGLF